ncbi:MAG: hypothetical protein NWE89_02450 [Candidatus Bathyarchaeota archaeon]|nr:hypothetical protein [Candidatus Bathyarchaeota archaeon]
MNPCRDCLKIYGDSLCSELGHCVFEGTNEKPQAPKEEEEIAAPVKFGDKPKKILVH